MLISDIRESRAAGETVLQARIRPEGADADLPLWFRFRGLESDDPDTGGLPDPFVIGMMPSCMLDGEDCRVSAPLPDMLKWNLAEAQRVLAGWFDFLSPVSLDGNGTDTSNVEKRAPEGVGCFFSGGVDSWYSVLRNRERITHLILIRGFDIGLENDALWNTARAGIDTAARRLGKRVITCETNLRVIADRGRAKWGAPFAGDFWGKCLHGAALGACAAALHGTVREVIVPATHTTATLKPWGSSPLLDKFWSSGRVRIVHDGCEANRFAKVRRIARSDIALQSLRVCYQNLAHTNCGRCEKCVRTMIALHVCGALDRTPAFGNGDPFAKLRRLDVPAHVIRHYELLLAEARSAGDSRLSRYLEVVLGRRFSAERALAKLVRRMRAARRRQSA